METTHPGVPLWTTHLLPSFYCRWSADQKSLHCCMTESAGVFQQNITAGHATIGSSKLHQCVKRFAGNCPSKMPPRCPLSDFLDSSIGQINNWVQGVATTMGHVKALARVGRCHVQLVPIAIQDDLLGARISTATLFRPFSSVAQVFKRMEEESMQISQHLPLVQPKKSGAGPRRNNTTARKAEHCQTKLW